MGAFSPTAISPKGQVYQGAAETFVFQGGNYKRYVSYPWTRENTNYIYACNRELGFGGIPNFSIYFRETFQSGSTGCCSTFGSPNLFDDEVEEEASDFEVLTQLLLNCVCDS